jgi:hypothetical protein
VTITYLSTSLTNTATSAANTNTTTAITHHHNHQALTALRVDDRITYVVFDIVGAKRRDLVLADNSFDLFSEAWSEQHLDPARLSVVVLCVDDDESGCNLTLT